MDLDVIVMKFREMQAQVAEIRERLGLTGKEPEESTTQPGPESEVEPEEVEEVEEHDPETGQTQKRRRRKG